VISRSRGVGGQAPAGASTGSPLLYAISRAAPWSGARSSAGPLVRRTRAPRGSSGAGRPRRGAARDRLWPESPPASARSRGVTVGRRVMQKVGASFLPAPEARGGADTSARARRIGEFSPMRPRWATRPSFSTRVGCDAASDGQISSMWTTVEMWTGW